MQKKRGLGAYLRGGVRVVPKEAGFVGEQSANAAFDRFFAVTSAKLCEQHKSVTQPFTKKKTPLLLTSTHL